MANKLLCIIQFELGAGTCIKIKLINTSAPDAETETETKTEEEETETVLRCFSTCVYHFSSSDYAGGDKRMRMENEPKLKHPQARQREREREREWVREWERERELPMRAVRACHRLWK